MTGVLEQQLVLSDRMRTFMHDGRPYAHVSGVPLAYLALSRQMLDDLRRFATAQRAASVWGGDVTRSDVHFVTSMVRAGVLVDAAAPDPIHRYRGARDLTRTLYLYPTNSCNLRCVYCYATSGPGAGPRLSREHADIAIEDFFATLDATVRAVELKFHGGGEPTTNVAVMESSWRLFSERARERNLMSRVFTITNGTFGARERELLSAPEWNVVFSYDGPRQRDQRPTPNDGDSRARVVANIHAFVAAGRRVTTRATLTREGLPFMRALVDDAADLGIASVQVEPCSIVGRGARLDDGPPDPAEFAATFLDALRYALTKGVVLTTSAWTHLRVGDGRYCGAITGARALTPDGFVSACTEACDGSPANEPFLVGRLDGGGQRLDIWPVKEAALQSRVGYALPDCATCSMVDTCAGGCAAKAHAESGDPLRRDSAHCTAARVINPALMADLAEGRLLPDDGWQPFTAETGGAKSALPEARLVAMVPRFARNRWNADPSRRPILLPGDAARQFVHLPS